MAAPPESSAEEPWRRFTPSSIDQGLCLARTWKGGAGGQCSKRPSGGQPFCTSHLGDRWQVHGRVDGPIPEKKLKEFERTAAASSSSSATAAGKRSCQADGGSEVHGRDTSNKQFETPRSSRRSPRQPGTEQPSEPELVPAQESKETDNLAPESSSQGPTTSQGSTLESPRASGQKPTAARTPSPKAGSRKRKAAKAFAPRPSRQKRKSMAKGHAPQAGLRTRKAGDAPVPQTSSRTTAGKQAAAPRASKAKAGPKPKAKPTKEAKVKCTCGKPIHTEKCKMFRIGFLTATPRKTYRPTGARKSPPRRSSKSPSKIMPPSSVHVSRTATLQVSEISAEIASMPISARKSAWRDRMRMFHPDKRQLMKAQFPQLSEDQMGEVFIEIKRRYDFMTEKEVTSSGKRFWGTESARMEKSPEY